MTYLPLLIASVTVAASMACGADTSTQELDGPQSTHVALAYRPPAVEPDTVALVPQNPADRSIRRVLSFAIDRDPGLKDRGISFIVSNGDVSVTGLVRTEDERERINELAMAIPDVKSIANALRVSP